MNWKHNKRWVYSITYDEGCRALLDHALPVHRRFGIPGHVALLAAQVGVPRQVPGSTYDGMMILSRDEIDALAAEGWGVSCHGMTHVRITDDNVRTELYESRLRLADALGRPVSLFCLPGSNDHWPLVQAHAVQAGYVGVLTIFDDINRPPPDRFRLCRVPLHTQYPPPFFSAFDPYKRLHQAAENGGWVIDYCHCPMPGKPIHPWKDCTVEELEARFDAVRRVGGNDVWIAEPNDVIEHLIQAERKS